MKIFRKIAAYPKTLALFLGGILALALPPYYLFPLLFLSFSGLLILLNLSSTAKRAFGLGYWFGFGFYAVGFSWISNAFLVDIERLGWLIPLTLAGSGAFFGLFVAIPAWLSFYFKNIYSKIFAFSALWVLSEWLRSFILTGFPWNLLGSVLAFDPVMIQAASVVGTYGLSLLVVFTCSFPAIIYFTPKPKIITVVMVTISLITLTIFSFGYNRLKTFGDENFSDIKVRIVQPSIPQELKWSQDTLEANFQKYIDFSTAAGFDDIDVVIWGETANPYILSLEPQYLEKIKKAVPENGFLITGSVEYIYDKKWYPLNSLLVINREKGILDSYNKTHLVPFGEYIPLRKYLPEGLKPVTNVIADFKPGEGVKTFDLPNLPSFGGLICYEIIFPAEVVDTKNRPEWLVNLTNDGWYGTGAGPYQHLVTTQLRAVEEGLSIVRVANSGISSLISRTGEIIYHIPLNQADIKDFNLPRQLSTETLYGKYHNKVPLIICFIFLLISYCILVIKCYINKILTE